MSYPSTKPEIYAFSAHCTAQIIRELGTDVDDSLAEQWASYMRNLVHVDDAIEQHEGLGDSVHVLHELGLPTTSSLINAAQRLLMTAQASANATVLREHLTSRELEAVSALDLMRFNAPIELSRNEYMWRQLSVLAKIGVLLDSFIDADEDSQVLPFAATDIRRKCASRIVVRCVSLDRRTAVASTRALGHFGLNIRTVPRMLRTYRDAV